MPFPIVPFAMAGLSLAEGIFQGQDARSHEKEADRMRKQTPRQDAGMLRLLNDIRQKRRYAETASSKIMGLKRNLINDAGAQTQTNLARNTGGDAGTLVDSQLRSQMATQRALAGAAADSEQLAPAYLQMEQPLVSDMAYRNLYLDLGDRSMEEAKAALMRRDSNDNIWGALGLLGSIDWAGDGSGAGGPRIGSATPPAGSTYKTAAGGESWDWLNQNDQINQPVMPIGYPPSEQEPLFG